MDTKLGKAIRIIRQAKDISMGDFANQCDVSASFISLVEKGRRQPSLDVLSRFATALGVPSAALVLMAVGPDSELNADGSTACRLADAVTKLIDMETQLTELLNIKEGEDENSGDCS